MLYLYAYTNHKSDLESLRRVAALYKDLNERGIECEILLNDYRAQLLLRDWGLPLATTIETIKDIDAVASIDDIVLIDSPEKIEGRVLDYPNKFKKVIYINSSCQEVEFDGADIINIVLDKKIIASNLDVDKKSKDSIFIFGDSDYDKIILKNLDLFKNKNLDLYWGIYFFVKYEDSLKEVFNDIIEPEEYYDILKEYKNIVTSSFQIALESAINGANVQFLKLKDISSCQEELLKSLDIKISNIIIDDLSVLLNKKIKNSNNEIINIIYDYM